MTHEPMPAAVPGRGSPMKALDRKSLHGGVAGVRAAARIPVSS
jgi:hypothetical protein